VERAGIDPGLIEDLVLGCGNPEGREARNIGRQAAIRAGLPITVAGSYGQPLLRLWTSGHR
jgi:acetyl-CoA C-acetyltransferase